MSGVGSDFVSAEYYSNVVLNTNKYLFEALLKLNAIKERPIESGEYRIAYFIEMRVTSHRVFNNFITFVHIQKNEDGVIQLGSYLKESNHIKCVYLDNYLWGIFYIIANDAE